MSQVKNLYQLFVYVILLFVWFLGIYRRLISQLFCLWPCFATTTYVRLYRDVHGLPQFRVKHLAKWFGLQKN